MRTADIDFLIIGAAKSATTWLQRALQNAPGVAMPDPELHYFSRAWERGPRWYLAQFPAAPPGTTARVVRGEKSNSYLADPLAPGRIREAMPDVRMIVQMRDPVARAYSDYCMLFRRAEVGTNVEDHLDPRRAADGRFLALGRYAEQIERFHEHFASDRFLHLAFEDTLARPMAALESVHRFLGLAPPRPEQLPGRVKDRGERMVAPELRRRLAPLKPLVAPLRGTAAFEAVRGRIAAPIAYPPLPEPLRGRMEDHYRPHNERLRRLTGLALSRWYDACDEAPAFAAHAPAAPPAAVLEG